MPRWSEYDDDLEDFSFIYCVWCHKVISDEVRHEEDMDFHPTCYKERMEKRKNRNSVGISEAETPLVDEEEE